MSCPKALVFAVAAVRRYSAPVRITMGSAIVWRAVDTSGNSEATRSIRP